MRRPYVLSSVDSLWDETRAPDGAHIGGVEGFAAPRRLFDPDGWRAIKDGFVDNLLREWARYAPNMTRENVIALRVNAIAPGYTDTEGARAIGDPATYDASATPLGRVGRPDDMTGTLRWLLGPGSAFVTGQVILVNGGRVTR